MRTESVEPLVAVLLNGERERQRLSETRRFGAIGLRLCHAYDALDRYRRYGVPNGGCTLFAGSRAAACGVGQWASPTEFGKRWSRYFPGFQPDFGALG